VVRLRDLGGGEPNDDLTWALFDDEQDEAGHGRLIVDRDDDEQTRRERAGSDVD
jgi:hypothetical protein